MAQAQNPAPILGRTPDNEVGISNRFEDGVTDLTYKDKGAFGEIWSLDPFVLTQATSFVSSLALSTKKLIGINVAPFPFGIAEITHGPNAGNNFVLIGQPRPPVIGIVDDQGNIVAGGDLKVVAGVPAEVELWELDVHPELDEIAVFDLLAPSFFFLDFDYQVVRGPFPTLGNPTYFGGGICYSSADTVLVVSGFRNNFDSSFALEYSRQTGEYTGRTISLANIGNNVISIGIDMGKFNNQDAMYVYNSLNDSLYAMAPTFNNYPGTVTNFNCSRGPTKSDPLKLTWQNNAKFGYNSLVIFQNGVQIATLPGDAVAFNAPSSLSGYSEFVIEARKDGDLNELHMHCLDQETRQPPFAVLQNTEIPVDPTRNHFQLGLDCTSVVENRGDFKLYLTGSSDNTLRVVGPLLNRLDQEDVFLQPPMQSTVQGGVITNLAITGVALTQLGDQPAFAILDGDGTSGNLAPSAGMFFADGQAVNAGAPMVPIDFNDIGGAQGSIFFDWDADAEGRLVSLDRANERIVEIVYDAPGNVFHATRQAVAPQKILAAIPGRTSVIGGISVLPNGMYLVSGGDSFDTTLTRAFLMTSFDDGAKFVGYTQGLVTFSQFFAPRIFGIGIGAEASFGLATAYFQSDNLGVTYYPSAHVFPTPGTGFRGNRLAHVTLNAAHPDLKGEQLLDLNVGLAQNGNFETLLLRPGFAAQVSKLNFYFYLINPSPTLEAVYKIEVGLNGAPAPEFTETVTIPPIRTLYRAISDRTEKDIQLRITNMSGRFEDVQAIIGSTGLAASSSNPLFKRGDADGSGTVDVTDPVVVLTSILLGAGKLTCEDAGDADDSGALDITDAVVSLIYQFAGGSIPAPGPLQCGVDPTADDLSPCVPAQTACP